MDYRSVPDPHLSSILLGAVHKRHRQLGGVKNWSKLLTDSTKNLPTWRRGVSKIRKKCRRRLWMVPHRIQHPILKVRILNCLFSFFVKKIAFSIRLNSYVVTFCLFWCSKNRDNQNKQQLFMKKLRFVHLGLVIVKS